MKVYQTRYTDKDGKRRTARKWYIGFTDHLQIRQRWAGLESKRQTEALGRRLEKLVNYKVAGETLDPEMTRWLESLPPRLTKKLVKIGLLDSQRAAGGKPLREHLSDFGRSLAAKGNTARYTKGTVSAVAKVFTGCKFVVWSDITASTLQRYLAGLRDGPDGISARTHNSYLQNVKSFCRWMVADRRATESPLTHLKGVNTKTDRRRERRPLEPDEIRRLLEATAAAPKRYGMAGAERRLLYLFAAESGLRANEIKNLKVRDFDFARLTVTVNAAYSKHRRQDVLPVRPETAALLQDFFGVKMPMAKAFGGSYKALTKRTAEMLRADLAEAGIPYIDEAGRVADFHSLRHTTGSLLAASGVHPKVAQTLMRHSDINLTMNRYTQVFRGQESDAIGKLPDLSGPSSQQQRAAVTGTDGKGAPSDGHFVIYSAPQGAPSADANGQHRTATPDNGKKNAVFSGRCRIRTCDRLIKRQLLDTAQAIVGQQVTDSQKIDFAICLGELLHEHPVLCKLIEVWPALSLDARESVRKITQEA